MSNMHVPTYMGMHMSALHHTRTLAQTHYSLPFQVARVFALSSMTCDDESAPLEPDGFMMSPHKLFMANQVQHPTLHYVG